MAMNSGRFVRRSIRCEKGCEKVLFRKEKRKCLRKTRHEIDRTEMQEWDNKKQLCDTKNKNERKRSHKTSHRFLFAPMNKKRKILFGKASFCTSRHRLKKASLAVETAMVLPMFFLGMVTMISFMDVYKQQTEHLMKLCKTAKEAGVYAYAAGGSGPEEITLPDVYSYQPVGGLVPLPKIWMHNTVKVHAWTGKSYEGFADSAAEEEEMVYVTESGGVYHRNPGCSYLNLSVSQVGGSRISSMRNSYGEKYAACEICSQNQKPGGTVYITKNGNRYHNLASCSGLKRNVRMVKISEAGTDRACSRCG